MGNNEVRPCHRASNCMPFDKLDELGQHTRFEGWFRVGIHLVWLDVDNIAIVRRHSVYFDQGPLEADSSIFRMVISIQPHCYFDQSPLNHPNHWAHWPDTRQMSHYKRCERMGPARMVFPVRPNESIEEQTLFILLLFSWLGKTKLTSL